MPTSWCSLSQQRALLSSGLDWSHQGCMAELALGRSSQSRAAPHICLPPHSRQKGFFSRLIFLSLWKFLELCRSPCLFRHLYQALPQHCCPQNWQVWSCFSTCVELCAQHQPGTALVVPFWLLRGSCLASAWIAEVLASVSDVEIAEGLPGASCSPSRAHPRKAPGLLCSSVSLGGLLECPPGSRKLPCYSQLAAGSPSLPCPRCTG